MKNRLFNLQVLPLAGGKKQGVQLIWGKQTFPYFEEGYPLRGTLTQVEEKIQELNHTPLLCFKFATTLKGTVFFRENI